MLKIYLVIKNNIKNIYKLRSKENNVNSSVLAFLFLFAIFGSMIFSIMHFLNFKHPDFGIPFSILGNIIAAVACIIFFTYIESQLKRINYSEKSILFRKVTRIKMNKLLVYLTMFSMFIIFIVLLIFVRVK